MKEQLTIAFLAYAGLGIAFCVYVSHKDKGSSRAVLAFISRDLVGLVFLAILWPLFAFIMIVEQTVTNSASIPKPPESTKSNIPLGAKGVVKTRMMPSGKIQIGDMSVDATSVFGSINQGEAIEIVGLELGEYKVRKVEQADEADAGNAPQ
ncbi:MAG: NfeD family protein [Roseibacillus sp.]|jgi:membrane-bound ClpP family serine protease